MRIDSKVCRLVTIGLALVLMLCGPYVASGQTTQERQPQVEEGDESQLTTGEQTVEVVAPTRDVEIRIRLTRILNATERFNHPVVEVDSGVVFLSGVTVAQADRQWAGDLARRTEGVVAVVNNIAIEEGPLWTLEPAVRETQRLWRQIVQALPLAAIGLVVLVVTWIAGRFLLAAIKKPLRRRVSSVLVRNVVEKLLLIGLVVVGVYLFLRISGLTRLAVTLAGGTGLLGLIVGFAFRDIAENFLASILISVQRPFRIGDTVEVDGHTGVIQKVTARGTVLMDFDGNHIQIANATVYKNTIRNFTANPKMRLGFVVGIGYDTGVTKAQDVVMEVLRGHSAVLDEPEPLVLVEELGAATIQVRIFFWINGHDHSILRVKSSLMRLVLRALEQAGISLPDEAREIIFPQGVPVNLIENQVPSSVSRRATESSEKDLDSEATEAEGDLRSEVAEIKQQASESRPPDEGIDIMSEDEDKTVTASADARA